MFFNKKKPAKAYEGPPLDPEWARNKRGKYPRLQHLDTMAEGLNGLSGVYVIWHSGVEPGWVYVGKSSNLANTLDDMLDNDEVMEFEKNGGLYVTWSPVREERQNGVVRFLHETMAPKVTNPAAESVKDGPVNVKLPNEQSRKPL